MPCNALTQIRHRLLVMLSAFRLGRNAFDIVKREKHETCSRAPEWGWSGMLSFEQTR